MSYSARQHLHYQVDKTRKVHRCRYCTVDIGKGEAAVKSYSGAYYHPECRKAQLEIIETGRWIEGEHYLCDHKRGSTEKQEATDV